jgi:phage baseplate assembly protein W
MATVSKQITYRDFDLRFIAHPITGKLNMLKNSNSVKQAVKNLILTNFYERPYAPLFGSGVRATLFENYTPHTQDDLEDAITMALNNFEPRVELISIDFGGNPDLNQLSVSIVFRPINTVEAITLNLSLDRVR